MYHRTPFKSLMYQLAMLPTDNHLKKEVLSRNQAINWLLEHYPKAFCLTSRQPLKETILADLFALKAENKPSNEAIKEAVEYYTNWGSYLDSLKEGATRIDLSGAPCGVVDSKSALEAQTQLAKAKQKHETR